MRLAQNRVQLRKYLYFIVDWKSRINLEEHGIDRLKQQFYLYDMQSNFDN